MNKDLKFGQCRGKYIASYNKEGIFGFIRRHVIDDSSSMKASHLAYWNLCFWFGSNWSKITCWSIVWLYVYCTYFLFPTTIASSAILLVRDFGKAIKVVLTVFINETCYVSPCPTVLGISWATKAPMQSHIQVGGGLTKRMSAVDKMGFLSPRSDPMRLLLSVYYVNRFIHTQSRTSVITYVKRR